MSKLYNLLFLCSPKCILPFWNAPEFRNLFRDSMNYRPCNSIASRQYVLLVLVVIIGQLEIGMAKTLQPYFFPPALITPYEKTCLCLLFIFARSKKSFRIIVGGRCRLIYWTNRQRRSYNEIIVNVILELLRKLESAQKIRSSSEVTYPETVLFVINSSFVLRIVVFMKESEFFFFYIYIIIISCTLWNCDDINSNL